MSSWSLWKPVSVLTFLRTHTYTQVNTAWLLSHLFGSVEQPRLLTSGCLSSPLTDFWEYSGAGQDLGASQLLTVQFTIVSALSTFGCRGSQLPLPELSRSTGPINLWFFRRRSSSPFPPSTPLPLPNEKQPLPAPGIWGWSWRQTHKCSASNLCTGKAPRTEKGTGWSYPGILRHSRGTLPTGIVAICN